MKKGKVKREGQVTSAAVKVKAEVPTASLNVPNGPGLASQLSDAELPEFCKATWSTKFLPTLYNRFAASDEPWVVAKEGEDLVNVVQDILDRCYPGSGYCVKWSDKICSTVRSQFLQCVLY